LAAGGAGLAGAAFGGACVTEVTFVDLALGCDDAGTVAVDTVGADIAGTFRGATLDGLTTVDDAEVVAECRVPVLTIGFVAGVDGRMVEGMLVDDSIGGIERMEAGFAALVTVSAHAVRSASGTRTSSKVDFTPGASHTNRLVAIRSLALAAQGAAIALVRVNGSARNQRLFIGR
jgi:hypothetical protein